MRISRTNLRLPLTLAVVAVAIVAFAATALAGPGGNGKGKGKGNQPAPSPSPTATATETPTDQPPPPPSNANEADAEFVRMMIPHHHQALIMSRMGPGASSNQDVLAIAARIDVEQRVEIASMQAWQESNGLPVTDPDAAYAMMMQNPMMIEMMGMATQAELDQLEASSGDAFDRLFLQLMIDHHQGAIDMILHVDLNGSDEYLRYMAGDMLNSQTVQIDMMKQMLTDIG